MATLQLPIDGTDRDYELIIPLGGADYIFRFRWEARIGSWFFDLFTASRTVLLYGQRVATDAPLNRAVKHVMPGTLVAVSTDDMDDSDPGETDLGNRVVVLYIED